MDDRLIPSDGLFQVLLRQNPFMHRFYNGGRIQTGSMRVSSQLPSFPAFNPLPDTSGCRLQTDNGRQPPADYAPGHTAFSYCGCEGSIKSSSSRMATGTQPMLLPRIHARQPCFLIRSVLTMGTVPCMIPQAGLVIPCFSSMKRSLRSKFRYSGCRNLAAYSAQIGPAIYRPSSHICSGHPFLMPESAVLVSGKIPYDGSKVSSAF